MSARGITAVGASAGCGKTHRLTLEVTGALLPDAAHRVPVGGLVAVTFTRKAHAELATRIRHALVRADALETASQLPLAYVGTVHSASLRLLKEFALDAGLSPAVDVLAGDPSVLLREALEHALTSDDRLTLDRLAGRLELRWEARAARFDWLTPVMDIMELARSNRIPPDALGEMAERSARGLLALLPPPLDDGDVLDRELVSELDRTAAALDRGADRTKATEGAQQLIDEARRRCRDGELRWSHWERLARVETGKASRREVERLREIAGSYEQHPRLRNDIAAIIAAIFGAARLGLDAYAAWKRERRVLDYVDMVDGALSLASHERVAKELERRLRLIVVDEMQDTSPIQLALFLRLHALARRSVWVGDRKQCIFEYAGADPGLMDSVARWVADHGGNRDTLGENRRSRPELVEFCSELFATAMERHGFSREEVAVRAYRPRQPELAQPLGLIVLGGSSADDASDGIATGVARLLQDPSSTPVLDRRTGLVRPLRAGDIALLVATNVEADRIAGALHRRGVHVALARAGVLSTPEGTLVDAALRVLIDPRDTLSAAIVDALTGFDGTDPNDWLAARLRARIRAEAPEHDEGANVGGDDTSWRAALAGVRASLEVLSPAETLDEVIEALDVLAICARWPSPVQRIGNVDALRALAHTYETRCLQDRAAATVSGLLAHFDELRVERLHRDEMRAADDQYVRADDGAVVVSTYHKAKGLEWPVVILCSLDRADKRHAFEVRPEVDDGREFDPAAPLEGRWIRYWPWPLGSLRRARLWDAARQSPEGQGVAVREERERVRLLYVGFTRARDHLVFALRTARGAAKKEWLDELAHAGGAPLLELPLDAADGASAVTRVTRAGGGAVETETRVWRLDANAPYDIADASDRDSDEVARWFQRATAAARPPTYWIAPSRAEDEWPDLPAARLGAVERISDGISLSRRGVEHDVVGTVVHGFLAADAEGLSPSARVMRARRLIDAGGLAGVLAPQTLLDASDAFRRWVAKRWPNAAWRREIPIQCPIASPYGERRLSGVIDLLLEAEDGAFIIDHKTFPSTSEGAWRAAMRKHLPQMSAYAVALERALDRPVAGLWLHLPVGGGAVEVIVPRARH